MPAHTLGELQALNRAGLPRASPSGSSTAGAGALGPQGRPAHARELQGRVAPGAVHLGRAAAMTRRSSARGSWGRRRRAPTASQRSVVAGDRRDAVAAVAARARAARTDACTRRRGASMTARCGWRRASRTSCCCTATQVCVWGGESTVALPRAPRPRRPQPAPGARRGAPDRRAPGSACCSRPAPTAATG